MKMTGRRRAGQGPRVGGPFAAPATQSVRVAQQQGHVVFVWGNPLAGASTALQILHEASRTRTALIDGTQPGWQEEVQQAVDEGVIALVDGTLNSPEDVQQLFDSGFVSAAGGIIVRLWTSDEEALRRADATERELTQDQLLTFRKKVAGIQARINLLSMPNSMIPNEFGSLDMAIGELARRGGVTS